MPARAMVTVIVLPLTQLLIRQMDVVADAILIEELIELLVIDTMRALDLPVETRRAWSDVDVSDVQRFEMPVELGLKLRAIVGLHYLNTERQTAKHFVDE